MIQSVRIEPQGNGQLRIDVQCECGVSVLTDHETGEEAFSHMIGTDGLEDKVLKCRCGKSYSLHPQSTHIHVFSG